MHSSWFITTKSRKKLQSSRFIANTTRESCNHLDLSPTKFAKMYSLFFQSSRFAASKSRFDDFFQKLYRFIASKSWKKLQSFQFITTKIRKNVFVFFNHLDLPLAKVALMLFCQKLFRFIASKSLKKVQLFWFVFSKTRKNLTIRFKQLNLPPANIFFFANREGKNHLDLSQAKFAKNTISESKIKNIAWNHIRDLSKQLVIKTVIWNYDLVQDFQFRFWYAIFDTNLVLWSEFNYKEIKIFLSIIFLNHKIFFFHHDIFVIQWQSGRPEKFTFSYLFCVHRRSRTGAVVDVNICLTIMSKFLSHQTDPTVHI